MAKRRKFYFGLLCVVLAVLLVFTMVYSYCAFTPTGYDKVEKSAAEARGRIAKAAMRRVDMATSASQPARLRIPEGAKRDGAEQDWAREMEEAFRVTPNWNDTHPSYQFYQYFISRNSPESFIELNRGAPATGERLWPALNAQSRDVVMQLVRNGFMNQKYGKNGLSQVNVEKIARELDRAEEFLLRKNRELPRGSIAGHNFYNLAIKTLLVIERACVNGEPVKALELFDGFLDVIRMMNFIYLYDGLFTDMFWYRTMLPFWRSLDQIPNFPKEWREHARGVLREIGGQKVEEADALIFTANAWHERCVEALKSDSNRHQNLWHYFAGGRLERIGAKAVYPIAARQIDAAAIALGRGDRAGYWMHMEAVRPMLSAMNTTARAVPGHRQLGADFSMRAKQVQEFVAMALENIRPVDGVTTESVEIDRFGDLTNFGNLRGDGLYQAVRAYMEKNKRAPRTPEEIEAFITENGHGEDWRKLVDWYEPARITLSWVVAKGKVNVNVQVEDKEFEDLVRRVLTGKGNK